MTGLTLTKDELCELARYKLPRRQLEVLHLRRFHRAYLAGDGTVILERAHYEAVCSGQMQPVRPRVKPPPAPMPRKAKR